MPLRPLPDPQRLAAPDAVGPRFGGRRRVGRPVAAVVRRLRRADAPSRPGDGRRRGRRRERRAGSREFDARQRVRAQHRRDVDVPEELRAPRRLGPAVDIRQQADAAELREHAGFGRRRAPALQPGRRPAARAPARVGPRDRERPAEYPAAPAVDRPRGARGVAGPLRLDARLRRAPRRGRRAGGPRLRAAAAGQAPRLRAPQARGGVGVRERAGLLTTARE
mmetsp:Transcript_11724/g.36165  ORF Transcript_11724/g.36165 Transcript_11724/m.36165 type:complete len:222 (-) Transcript_11724:9-674(-)